jgi:hypothetical protein
MNVASVDKRTGSNPTWPVISVYTSLLHILTILGQLSWQHPTSQVFTTPTKILSSLRSQSSCSRAGRGKITVWNVSTAPLCKSVLNNVAHSYDLDIQLLQIQMNCCKHNHTTGITVRSIIIYVYKVKEEKLSL